MNVAIQKAMKTQDGDSIWELSSKQPVMLVFLRHFGCTFCREALGDIARERPRIEKTGVRLVFVHMSDRETADRYFDRYDLLPVRHVSDPDCRFYQAFGLTRGRFTQLVGLHSFIRGFDAAFKQGHGVGVRQIGDGFQMPGIFVLHKGQLRESFIHKLSSDRPDYLKLATNCCDWPQAV